MVEILASSTGVRSGFARHGRALISIILFQSLLIVWLSSWAVGDYLNNQYVRAYVNLTIQTDSWLIGTVFLVGILGSSAGLVLRRKRHSANTLGIVSTHSKIPKPTLATASAKTTAQPMASSKPGAQPSVTSVSFSKPSTELHPAVAALKADLSEARMSLGLASVATGGGTSPATKPEDHEIAAPQRPAVMNSPLFGPRPQTSAPSQTQPTTTIQPAPHSTPTSLNPRPLPPTVIRPMAPPSPSGPSATGQIMPLLKVENSSPPTPRPVGLLPRPQTAQAMPKDVSTVITGIMPSQQQQSPQQQKKKESESSDGQSNSQQ